MKSRFAIATVLLGFAVAPTAYADAQSNPAAAQQAKYEQEAAKSCNYDLDHDRFGNYGSIDECVSDRAQKLAEAGVTKSTTVQPAVPKR
jgi:hypothetical protein